MKTGWYCPYLGLYFINNSAHTDTSLQRWSFPPTPLQANNLPTVVWASSVWDRAGDTNPVKDPSLSEGTVMHTHGRLICTYTLCRASDEECVCVCVSPCSQCHYRGCRLSDCQKNFTATQGSRPRCYHNLIWTQWKKHVPETCQNHRKTTRGVRVWYKEEQHRNSIECIAQLGPIPILLLGWLVLKWNYTVPNSRWY